MDKIVSKCDFCRYWTGGSCMTIPNSVYCKEALYEYQQYLANLKNGNTQRPVKSLRPWDRK